jgi:hypothetical protein
MAVLPLSIALALSVQIAMSRRLCEKELAEAKQAVLLDAPEHQKLKEVSEV